MPQHITSRFWVSLRTYICGAVLCVIVLPAHAAEKAVAPLAVGGAIKAEANDKGFAQQPTASELKKIPLVNNILQGGAELYYLGPRSGLDGFLIFKAGQIQVLYLTPDRQTVLFGGMFSGDGANISAQQISMAADSNAQLKGVLAAAGEQQRELETSGNSGKDATALTAKAGANDATSKAPAIPQPVSLSPGERLFNDFINASGVVVGQAGKPLVLMLVDPHCPFCKATWKELYEPLTKGSLRVKLIPIGAEGSENERQAAKFLRIPDPMNVWNQFANGDKTVLAGDASTADLTAVRANMAMALGWKIQATPYLVYRGTDNKIKVVQGKPEKIAAILSDIKQ